MRLWFPSLLIFLMSFLSLQIPAAAEEGMYPLTGVEAMPLRAIKKAGAEVRGSEIIRLSKAVVQVAGGGTGSFVSDSGLVVTNHHVAYGCLAALDAMEEHKGILEAGFVAHELTEEIPCPGYYLLLLEETRNITAQVRKASAGLPDYHARFEAERLAKEALVAECEKEGEHICKASSLNGGLEENLSVYTRVLDVRLVYAPEKDIGKYGGDIDNWMYPRHTGDYAFLRAYVAPDGKPAAHDAANLAYEPQVHLRITDLGLKLDDFVMVMGYPARTKRFTTATGTAFYLEESVPASLETYGPMLKLLEGLGAAYASVERRYAGLIAGLNNATKYYGESKAGLEASGLVAKKQEATRQLRKQLKGKKLKALDDALAAIDELYAEYRSYHRLFYVLGRMTSLGSNALVMAHTLHKWSVEKLKPEAERKGDRYKEKNVYALYERSERLELTVDFRAEVAILTYYLRTLGALEGKYKAEAVGTLLADTDALLATLREETDDDHPTVGDVVRREFGIMLPEEAVARAATLLLARTKAVSWSREEAAVGAAIERRKGWLDMDGASFATEVEDPLVVFARNLDRDLEGLREGPFREVEERLATELHRDWVKAVKAPYPDANFTLRLSFGKVKDYTATATGKTHRYMTTLGELLGKETGKWPFKVPARLAAAAKEDLGRWKDEVLGDVAINFTSTLDTTGGNSGSPVLDSKGRLVGLLFDGTSESILSDWQYLEAEQRSICVDIRFALFLAERVHGATELMVEIGLAQ